MEDLSSFYRKDLEEKRAIRGVEFTLREPEDADAVLDMILSDRGRASALKKLCLAVVREPDLSAEWEKFGYAGRMAVLAEVVDFLGLGRDFLA